MDETQQKLEMLGGELDDMCRRLGMGDSFQVRTWCPNIAAYGRPCAVFHYSSGKSQPVCDGLTHVSRTGLATNSPPRRPEMLPLGLQRGNTGSDDRFSRKLLC